jgi:hypothetical protein
MRRRTFTSTSSPTSRSAACARDAYDDLLGCGRFYAALTPAERGATSFQHAAHVRNSLDCVKSRSRPVADVEIGHRSTAACLLGNTAPRTGEALRWDAAKEQFTGASAQATALLRRDYRAPWALAGL